MKKPAVVAVVAAAIESACGCCGSLDAERSEGSIQSNNVPGYNNKKCRKIKRFFVSRKKRGAKKEKKKTPTGIKVS